MELILASTSRYRRSLMERLGVPFHCVPPLVDEESLKNPEMPPQLLAEYLSIAKTHSLCEAYPEATLVGGDQVLAIEGRILSKPGTRERAIEQLTALAGRSHQLFTAMTVRHKDRSVSHVDVTTLTMRPLTPEAIERYVAADQPLDAAGSYILEQRGVTLFESIVSADHTAVTGLPLIELTTILRSFGFLIP